MNPDTQLQLKVNSRTGYDLYYAVPDIIYNVDLFKQQDR